MELVILKISLNAQDALMGSIFRTINAKDAKEDVLLAQIMKTVIFVYQDTN